MRFLFLIILLTSPVLADSATPSTSTVDKKKDAMDALDAAQFDAATAHIVVIDRDYKAKRAELDKNAEEVRKPFVETFLRICKKYSIDPAQLGSTINVDTATGNIMRKQTPPVKAPKK